MSLFPTAGMELYESTKEKPRLQKGIASALHQVLIHKVNCI